MDWRRSWTCSCVESWKGVSTESGSDDDAYQQTYMDLRAKWLMGQLDRHLEDVARPILFWLLLLLRHGGRLSDSVIICCGHG